MNDVDIVRIGHFETSQFLGSLESAGRRFQSRDAPQFAQPEVPASRTGHVSSQRITHDVDSAGRGSVSDEEVEELGDVHADGVGAKCRWISINRDGQVR